MQSMFKYSAPRGKRGENIIKQALEDKGHIVQIAPARALYDLYGNCEYPYKLEIKTSYKGEHTGNLFYEYSMSDGIIGWTQKYNNINTIHIVWLLPVSQILYILPCNKLKDIPYNRYETAVVNNPRYSATGYKVPFEEVLNSGGFKIHISNLSSFLCTPENKLICPIESFT